MGGEETDSPRTGDDYWGCPRGSCHERSKSGKLLLLQL